MYKQAVILLLMLFTASVSAALPARYMQTIENAAVWAQIGDKMVTVGNIRAGQIIAVEPTAASYYAFYFGFGSVLLIASLIWYLVEEIQLIFKTNENTN